MPPTQVFGVFFWLAASCSLNCGGAPETRESTEAGPEASLVEAGVVEAGLPEASPETGPEASVPEAQACPTDDVHSCGVCGHDARGAQRDGWRLVLRRGVRARAELVRTGVGGLRWGPKQRM